jgi:ATP-binding cassette, subfamily B, bacterial
VAADRGLSPPAFDIPWSSLKIGAVSVSVETKSEGTFTLALRLLRRSTVGEGRRIVLGLTLMLMASAAALLQPWPLKFILDGIVGKHALPAWLESVRNWFSPEQSQMALITMLCVAMLVIHIVISSLQVVNTAVIVGIGLRMVFKLRCALFNHLQRLSLKFHDATTVGDSLYRVAWDTYCIQTMFNSGFVPTINATITLIGLSAIMLYMDWVLTLTAMGVALPLVVLIRRMDRPMQEHSMRMHERESDITARIQETLSGIRVVQAFGQEGTEDKRFREQAGASLLASLRLTVLQTASGAVVGLFLAAGTAAVVWIAAMRVIEGRLTPGDVVLLVAYVGMLYGPVYTLAYTVTTLQGASAGAKRVYAILDSVPDVADAPDAIDLPGRAAGRVTFENVGFAYQPDQPVLRNVELEVEPGSTVALVGPSGAGKTTFVSLVLRFYDPIAGRIMVDGHDLRRLTLASLRGNISLVLQEPVLFATTIRENIAYGRPEASMEQIIAAAEAAGAHEFIKALPEGYETRIGERGSRLSGGQRQRLSIARAFLKDAPILIMDEPTSALDAGTEAALLEAMDRLKQGRTTIIIAHRLSTIRDADVIVVMQAGEVVETGSHEELLSRETLYSRLHHVQFGSSAHAATTG